MELVEVRAVKTALMNEYRHALLDDTGWSYEQSLSGFIAFGVAPTRTSGFHLALRLSRPSNFANDLVEKARRLCRGELDVRVVGDTVACAGGPITWENGPMHMGCSIGHQSGNAGSFSCFVMGRHAPTLFALASNHVIACENKAIFGDRVYAPSLMDDFTGQRREVATLSAFVPIRYDSVNYVDAAIARVHRDIEHEVVPRPFGNYIETVGLLKVPVPVEEELDSVFVKVGRTTGLTRGRLTAFEMDELPVRTLGGIAVFANQLEFESLTMRPFAKPGDSGAVVATWDGHGVGVLFAVTEAGGVQGGGLAYANGLTTVLDMLDIRLLT